jgi:hypothetical protein
MHSIRYSGRFILSTTPSSHHEDKLAGTLYRRFFLLSRLYRQLYRRDGLWDNTSVLMKV